MRAEKENKHKIAKGGLTLIASKTRGTFPPSGHSLTTKPKAKRSEKIECLFRLSGWFSSLSSGVTIPWRQCHTLGTSETIMNVQQRYTRTLKPQRDDSKDVKTEWPSVDGSDSLAFY